MKGAVIFSHQLTKQKETRSKFNTMQDDQNYQPITINGVTYLPMDALFTSESNITKKFEAAAIAMGCIRQRVKFLNRHKGILYDSADMALVYLVPAEKMQEFVNLTA